MVIQSLKLMFQNWKSTDNKLVIEAEVPMSEMHKYATDLRSMTQGRGSFTFEFVRYEIAPKEVEQVVVSQAK